MRLSRQSLNQLSRQKNLRLPDPAVFGLPEKVLQFGTGVFLRGLIDYFIDKANNEGFFNGRVVMVKSTDAGDIKDLKDQDCLYTLLMRSVDEGMEMEEKVVCAAVSRVLDAKKDWAAVLACATNPDLRVIISNTTEAGIVLAEETGIGPTQDTGTGPAGSRLPNDSPPISFPGKLLAFLLERYKVFKGSAESGLVIVPTELIPDNATILKKILNELAHRNKLPPPFIAWMNTANDFCNSLVDRIVPGKLPPGEQKEVESILGYEDNGMIMAETFGLWAIGTSSPRSREILSFSKAHPGIHLVDDIAKFRELKLRLLNGSHNLSCALGCIAGFGTVKEAMADPAFDGYMRGLILDEIAPAILSDLISLEEAHAFGASVLDRYRNPFIEFEWLSICVQDTDKIRIRAVPIVLQHYQKYGYVPDRIALSFAAYILFMRSSRDARGQYVGHSGGREYLLADDHAAALHTKWERYAGGMPLVRSVLEDEKLWGTNLQLLTGLDASVAFYLANLDTLGFFPTIALSFMPSIQLKK